MQKLNEILKKLNTYNLERVRKFAENVQLEQRCNVPEGRWAKPNRTLYVIAAQFKYGNGDDIHGFVESEHLAKEIVDRFNKESSNYNLGPFDSTFFYDRVDYYDHGDNWDGGDDRNPNTIAVVAGVELDEGLGLIQVPSRGYATQEFVINEVPDLQWSKVDIFGDK
jgi:hypothetical protein